MPGSSPSRRAIVALTFLSVLAAPVASIVGGTADPLGNPQPTWADYLLLPLMVLFLVVMQGYVQLLLTAVTAWVRPPAIRIACSVSAWALALDHALYAAVPHDLGSSVASSMATFSYPIGQAPIWLGISLVAAAADRLIAGKRVRTTPKDERWSRPPGAL